MLEENEDTPRLDMTDTMVVTEQLKNVTIKSKQERGEEAARLSYHAITLNVSPFALQEAEEGKHVEAGRIEEPDRELEKDSQPDQTIPAIVVGGLIEEKNGAN